MVANGLANLLGSVGSAYPVSGSFSRSSLNYACGARTPLSKMTTLMIVLLALGTLTESFRYIPNAALSAVIFAAIYNLVNVSDFWEAWKHSKKDFLTMLVTCTIVFVFDTSTGLAVGLGCSFLVYLFDIVTGQAYRPTVVSSAKETNGIDVVKLETDLNFLTAQRVKDFATALHTQKPVVPDASTSTSEYLHFTVSSAFDRALIPHDESLYVDFLPVAIAIDFSAVRVLDITGLQTLSEIMAEARAKGVHVVAFNIKESLVEEMTKFGITNDASTPEANLDEYLKQSQLNVRKIHRHYPDEYEEAKKAGTDIEENGDERFNDRFEKA
jgi:MFS superfamily sulfate permease-like transporter